MLRLRALRLILVCALLALSARPAMPPVSLDQVVLVASEEREPTASEKATEQVAALRPVHQHREHTSHALQDRSARVAPRKLYLRHCALLA